MSEELKPCPCGKKASYMQCAFGRWSVHCECGFCLEGEYTKERARQLWNTRAESKPLTYVQLQSTYSKAYHDFLNAFPKGPDPARNNKAHEAGLSAIHASLPSQDEKDRRIAELEKAVDARQDLIERWRELALSREKIISALKADMQQILESHDMEQAQTESAEKRVAELENQYTELAQFDNLRLQKLSNQIIELTTAYKAMREALVKAVDDLDTARTMLHSPVNQGSVVKYNNYVANQVPKFNAILTQYPEIK